MQLPPISVTFTCVSFNILNKCNVESHMYPYCTSLDLDPDFRISKLLQWLFSVGGENANSTTFRTESSFHLKSSNNHFIQQQVSTQTSILQISLLDEISKNEHVGRRNTQLPTSIQKFVNIFDMTELVITSVNAFHNTWFNCICKPKWK